MDADDLRNYLEFYQDLGVKDLYRKAAPPLPAAETKPVVVASAPELPPLAPDGDTLLKIAQANYGSAKLWHELAKYNNVSESGLRIGAKIKLPSREALTGKPTKKQIGTGFVSLTKDNLAENSGAAYKSSC